MKKTKIRRFLSVILVLALTAAMALTFASCSGKSTEAQTTKSAEVTDKTNENKSSDNSDGNKNSADNNEKTDNITISVEVIGSDKKAKSFTIKTDEKTLRGALEQEKLVSGDEGPFGLYVKIVNGETADYDKNKAYWAFYKGDQYLTSSIDSTVISDGDTYRIVYTK